MEWENYLKNQVTPSKRPQLLHVLTPVLPWNQHSLEPAFLLLVPIDPMNK